MADMEWITEDMETYQERFALMAERIRRIPGEQDIPGEYRDYFMRAVPFLLKTAEIFEKQQNGRWRSGRWQNARQIRTTCTGICVPNIMGAAMRTLPTR